MADAIVTLTETPQVTLLSPLLDNYYWNMAGATKVTPYKAVRDTVAVGSTYVVYYIDVPASRSITISHNLSSQDISIYDQDRSPVYNEYGIHNVDVSGARSQFRYFRTLTNPDPENALRIYIQFNAAAGTAIKFYYEEDHWLNYAPELLSRLNKGLPLTNNDIDHITGHINRTQFENIEAPLKPFRRWCNGDIATRLVGRDDFGLWKVELVNSDGSEYNAFIVNFSAHTYIRIAGSTGSIGFYNDTIDPLSDVWMAAVSWTGWATVTPMGNITLADHPDLRLMDRN